MCRHLSESRLHELCIIHVQLPSTVGSYKNLPLPREPEYYMVPAIYNLPLPVPQAEHLL